MSYFSFLNIFISSYMVVCSKFSGAFHFFWILFFCFRLICPPPWSCGPLISHFFCGWEFIISLMVGYYFIEWFYCVGSRKHSWRKGCIVVHIKYFKILNYSGTAILNNKQRRAYGYICRFHIRIWYDLRVNYCIRVIIRYSHF